MGAITYREGGAIPAKQLRDLAAALGAGDGDLPTPAQLLASAAVASAWDGARLVGLARLVGDGDGLAVLQHVGVDPAYRRQGVGQALVRACLAGCAGATVVALPRGAGAAAFLAGCGLTQRATALVRPAPLTAVDRR
ncbi:MAG TPA: GNAT family N-acetyltransferase [Thermomicrobiales bacterium]|nr:GNAT family N-acetyltransferase [Thermomicrobiales bacterium]